MMSYRMKRKLVMGIIVAVFAVLMLFVFGGMKASADSTLRVNERKFFTSYVVKSGDCLWDIAGDYMTKEYADRYDYIDEVIESNQLESDDLYPGQLLILPYYADAPIEDCLVLSMDN